MTTEERKQKGRKSGISIEYIITWNKRLMNEERSIDNNNTRVLIMKMLLLFLPFFYSILTFSSSWHWLHYERLSHASGNFGDSYQALWTPKMHCRWSSALWTSYHIVGQLLKGRTDADVGCTEDGQDGRIGATKYAGGNGARKEAEKRDV